MKANQKGGERKKTKPNHDNRWRNLLKIKGLEATADETGQNRWAYLVLFVLSGVGKAWNYGGDSRGRCDFACVYHDKEFH